MPYDTRRSTKHPSKPHYGQINITLSVAKIHHENFTPLRTYGHGLADWPHGETRHERTNQRAPSCMFLCRQVLWGVIFLRQSGRHQVELIFLHQMQRIFSRGIIFVRIRLFAHPHSYADLSKPFSSLLKLQPRYF